jgi:UrcA family protein
MLQRDSGRRFGFGEAAIIAVVLAGIGAANADQATKSLDSRSALNATAADGGKAAFSLPVRYSDLDLSVASDGAILLARIKIAARRVCQSATPQTQLKPHRVAECANETVEGLVQQLGIETLTLAWSSGRPDEPRVTAGRVQ